CAGPAPCFATPFTRRSGHSATPTGDDRSGTPAIVVNFSVQQAIDRQKPTMRLPLLSVALLTTVFAADPSPPCPFCEIVAGNRQQEGIVYRDEEVTAFLSLGARNPGHIL